MPSEAAREQQVRVGRPPFAFRISGPDDWLLLETEPNAWQPSVDRVFAQSRHALGRLTARERRELRDLMETVVIAAQESGVILSLVKLARTTGAAPGTDGRGGGVFCGSLALSWYDSTPVQADLPFCRLVAGDAEDLEEFDGAAGACLLRCETMPHQEPWDRLFAGERAFAAQGFVPIEGTSWTALVSGTVNSTGHAELLRNLVRRMAASIRLATDSPDGAGDGPPAGTRPRGSSMSRFGSQRRIDKAARPSGSGMDGRWRRPHGAWPA